MVDTQNSSYKAKRIWVVILIIGATVFLIDLMSRDIDDPSFYLILVITVLLNVYGFLYVAFSFSAGVKHQTTAKQMSVIIDDLPCSTPVFEETYVQKSDSDLVGTDTHTSSTKRKKSRPSPTIDIPKPLQMIPATPIYHEPADAANYLNLLSTYINQCGLSIDHNDAREMFACMAASKLIVLKHEHQTIAQRFLELFTDFVGAFLFIDEIDEDSVRFIDLLSNPHQLHRCIKSAQEHPDMIHVMLLSDISLSLFAEHFREVMAYALDPLLPCVIKHPDFQRIPLMPENLWFAVIPDQNTEDFESGPLARSAMTMTLTTQVTPPLDSVHQNPLKLSHRSLANLLVEGYRKHHLEEEDWKKIDQINLYLRQQTQQTIDNRLFRQLERYTSTFMIFGGDTNDCIDRMLSSKLLRLLRTTLPDLGNEAREDLIRLLERLYESDDLNKSKSLYRLIQARQ